LKVLILNGADKDDSLIDSIHKIIEDKLMNSGCEIKTYLLGECEIKDCQGCFRCWFETPGLCIYDDISREISGEYVNSDLAILITPVIFGCYSYHAKKSMDRMIPNVLPFFRRYKGEIHHLPRYAKYPDIYIIGVVPDDESAGIFEKLLQRNHLNFEGENFTYSIFYIDRSPDEIKVEIDRSLSSREIQI